MTFTDFYINCELDLPKITQALSSAFGVLPHEIEIAIDNTDFSFQSQLNCEIQTRGGDFPYRLKLTSIDHDVLDIDMLGKIADCCELLGCVGFDFGPELNTNPYTGMLIYRRENYQQVQLDYNLLLHERRLVVRDYGKMFAHPDEWDDNAFSDPIE
jgi:hypothetical protein